MMQKDVAKAIGFGARHKGNHRRGRQQAQLIRPEEMDQVMDVLSWHGRQKEVGLDDLIAKRKKETQDA